MRPAVRQRIIGLGLLVLLLIILVPWALKVPEGMELQLDASIPPPPEVDWQSLAPEVTPAQRQQLKQRIAQQRAALLAPAATGKQTSKTAGLRAYALQLAVYGKRSQAVKQRQALNDAGYHAYVRATDKGFVLYAGPELQQTRLGELAERLAEDKRFSFDNSKQVYYQP